MAREWWFHLTMYGEYSKPFHEGKHFAWKDDPDHEFVHVREVLPDEITISRELAQSLVGALEEDGNTFEPYEKLREALK